MSFSTPYCVVTVAPNKNTAMPMCATTISKNAVEKDIKMSLNAFTFKGVSALQGANYTGNKGVIDVVYQGAKIATLKPEKRQYTTNAISPMKIKMLPIPHKYCLLQNK
jgi:cytochrome c biogenesis factor